MRKTIATLALLSGGLLSSVALGQSWGNFEAAFPMFPCHDGWMACRVEGQTVSPDLARDGTGMPVPADFRLGWFDLKPTASFSPFGGLSVYTGAAPARVAEPAPEPVVAAVAPVAPKVDPELVRRQQEAESERRRLAEQEGALDDARRQREAEEREAKAAQAAAAQASARAEAERKKADEEAARKRAEEEALAKQLAAAQADGDRKRIEAEQKRLAEERKKAEEDAARKRAEEDARRKAEEEARVKAEQEAKARAEAERKAEEDRKRLEAERKAQEEASRKLEEERRAAEAKAKEEADRLAAEKKREEDARAAAAAAAPAPSAQPVIAAAAVSVDAGDCSDIVSMEPHAMLGRLSAGQQSCLEGSLAAAAKMTDKDKISRVLMLNAFGKGDIPAWEKLIKRHLAEIDQSDPDLCYKYAVHLGKKGAGSATSVIHWSDVALENRTVWTGDTYTNRVFSLYKLRAAAAQMLWQKAEGDFASSPSEKVQADIDKWRAQTKVLSREWYEYAKVAGKDSSKALQLCMSAAGTREYCEAG